MGELLDALVADEEHNRIHRDEQADEGRDDARNPADEGFAALVEHADEALGKENQGIHECVSFPVETKSNQSYA